MTSIRYKLLLRDGVLVDIAVSSELFSVFEDSDEDRRGMRGYDFDEVTLRVCARTAFLVVGGLGVASSIGD